MLYAKTLITLVALAAAAPTTVFALPEGAPECIAPCIDAAATENSCTTYNKDDINTWVECACTMPKPALDKTATCAKNSCDLLDLAGALEIFAKFKSTDCDQVKATMTTKLAASSTAAATATTETTASTTTPAAVATTATGTDAAPPTDGNAAAPTSPAYVDPSSDATSAALGVAGSVALMVAAIASLQVL